MKLADLNDLNTKIYRLCVAAQDWLEDYAGVEDIMQVWGVEQELSRIRIDYEANDGEMKAYLIEGEELNTIDFLDLDGMM